MKKEDLDEVLVSTKTAVTLKNKGFDLKCAFALICSDLSVTKYTLSHFKNNSSLEEFKYRTDHNNREHRCSVPRLSLVGAWFRDAHNIHISPNCVGEKWTWSVYSTSGTLLDVSDVEFDSHDLAYEDAVNNSLPFLGQKVKKKT